MLINYLKSMLLKNLFNLLHLLDYSKLFHKFSIVLLVQIVDVCLKNLLESRVSLTFFLSIKMLNTDKLILIRSTLLTILIVMPPLVSLQSVLLVKKLNELNSCLKNFLLLNIYNMWNHFFIKIGFAFIITTLQNLLIMSELVQRNTQPFKMLLIFIKRFLSYFYITLILTFIWQSSFIESSQWHRYMESYGFLFFVYFCWPD